MDNNNKRDYSDFFRANGDEPNRDNHNERRPDQTEKPSYYYSYGPFKPSAGDGAEETTTASSDSGTSKVEITTPRPVRPYYGYSERGGQMQPAASAQNPWEFSGGKKKSSSFKSYVATFLAGAVVVGSLMFASDKWNLFSEAGALSPTSSASASSVTRTNGNGGNGGATTAALETVVRPDTIAQIVSSASPAVVKINTYAKANSRSRSGMSNDIFDYFFGNGQRQQPNTGNQRQTLGMGSGFIFDKEGYILTNEHVINGADEIEVEVQGYAEPLKAKLLGSEYSLDLAVLKIEKQSGKEFDMLQLGSSDDINVGDWVVAIGNPYGFDHTVTVGVLSAKERPIDIRDTQGTREYNHLLQTDASINPGNSGGPLLNLQGQVIGINTAVSSQAQGIGFAIPTSTVTSVLENLKNNVKIPIPYIGVNIQNVPEEWVEALKLDNTEGTIIASVVQGSPAAMADLQPRDVITEVNGTKVKDTEQFRDTIKSLKVGDNVTLTVRRNGQTLKTVVTVGDMNK